MTDQGDYRAEKIVLAAGVWSCQLLKRFGIKLPLEAERGYHLVLRNPALRSIIQLWMPSRNM